MSAHLRAASSYLLPGLQPTQREIGWICLSTAASGCHPTLSACLAYMAAMYFDDQGGKASQDQNCWCMVVHEHKHQNKVGEAACVTWYLAVSAVSKHYPALLC